MATFPCADPNFLPLTPAILTQLQNVNSDYSVETNCIDSVDWWNDNIFSGRRGNSVSFSDQVGEISYKGLNPSTPTTLV